MLEIFKKAKQGKYAIGAFNVSNLEQVKAIVQAAQKLKAPLIIATSEGESNFIGKRQVKAVVGAWQQEAGLPIILHLDHGKSFEVIKEAIGVGYHSVHFDGSGLPFEENVAITKKVVDFARAQGVLNIEGELGYLRGKSALQETVEIKEEDLTDPDQALEFVKKTKVDSLAIAIGNIHGIIKGQRFENPPLFLDRLEKINARLGDRVGLVLHGGSGTPQEDIKKVIQLGIVKINVNTELRIAYTDSLRKFLKENLQETAPYKIMPQVIEAVQSVIEEKIKLFGSENKV